MPTAAGAELSADASLPAHAHADAPPFFIQHGAADTMAPFDQGRRLHDALLAAGAGSTLDRSTGPSTSSGGCDDATVAALFDRALAFAHACVAAHG